MAEVNMWGWHGLAMGQGRLNRKEYWMVVGAVWGFDFVWGFVTALLGAAQAAQPFTIVLNVISFWLMISAMIRRLHDTGRSGWWVLALIPASMLAGMLSGVLGAAFGSTATPYQLGQVGGTILGFVAIVALGCVPGRMDANRFGGTAIAKTFS